MKNILTTFFCIFCLVAFSNNIKVSNVSFTAQNVIRNCVNIRFDISWENSWQCDLPGAGNAAPYNYDAAWIFVKFRTEGGWQHASLDTTGTLSPAGTETEVGLLNPGEPFLAASNPGMGVFIFRDANGSGTLVAEGVEIRWNYGLDGVDDNALADIRVFAVEHVCVPEGSFYAGSGGTEGSGFYKYPLATDPYYITNEDMIPVGTQQDDLYYDSTQFGGDRQGPIPAAFPKGFRSFYCMKYEITQQEYVDFLNTLTQPQATARKHSGAANRYRITGTAVGSYATSNPYVACSYLNWADLTAYFDWCSLRPLTELEFEKACRGTLVPVPNEYAWGNALVTVAPYTLENSGDSTENILNNYNTAAGNAAYSMTTPYNGSINGPLRAGIFAANSSNTGRVTAGATYYGIMEMSGNLLEHFVTAGNPEGRLFTGKHGDGEITGSGLADVDNWPGASSLGAGFRGGYWYYYNWYLRVSERSGAAGTDPVRYPSDGGRGGRSK